MRTAFFVSVISVIVISGLTVAGPLNKAHVPADSLWIAHIDCSAFRASQFGQLILGEISRQHQEKIDALSQLLGTDLTKDIDAITLYGPDAAQENAVAVIYGRFDRIKLLTLLKLNAAYSESTYKNYSVYHWKDDKKQISQVGAFTADSSIVISQTEAALGKALDVLDGQSPALASTPQSLLFGLTEAPAQTILVTAAQSLTELVKANPHAAILQNSSIIAVVAGETSGQMKLQIRLDAATVEAAQQIEMIVRGMMAFGTLQQDTIPQLAPLIGAIQLIRQDKQLEIVFQYNSAELLKLAKAQIPWPAHTPQPAL